MIAEPTAAALPGIGNSAMPVRGLLQLLASVILLSSAWSFTKIALSAGSTPLWFAEGRAVLSGLVAFLLRAALGRLRRPSAADWPTVLTVGGLQLGAYFAFAHEAVAWISARRTAILANTTTVWVVPLSLLFLREHIPLRRWLAAALGLTGVAILVNPLAVDWGSRDTIIGHAFLLGAASWWALAYIGLIAGPLGTRCVMQATASLPTLVSSLGFLATPAVSLILANVLLHEPFTADLLLGSALIMGGVGIAAWPGRRRA